MGGLNEKIEGFFAICEQRELNGKQGVIIPAANVRHLSLKSELLQAVKKKFTNIWAVDVTDALPLPVKSGVGWRRSNDVDANYPRSVSRRRRSNRKAVIVSRGYYLRWLNAFYSN